MWRAYSQWSNWKLNIISRPFNLGHTTRHACIDTLLKCRCYFMQPHCKVRLYFISGVLLFHAATECTKNLVSFYTWKYLFIKRLCFWEHTPSSAEHTSSQILFCSLSFCYVKCLIPVITTAQQCTAKDRWTVQKRQSWDGLEELHNHCLKSMYQRHSHTSLHH